MDRKTDQHGKLSGPKTGPTPLRSWVDCPITGGRSIMQKARFNGKWYGLSYGVLFAAVHTPCEKWWRLSVHREWVYVNIVTSVIGVISTELSRSASVQARTVRPGDRRFKVVLFVKPGSNLLANQTRFTYLINTHSYQLTKRNMIYTSKPKPCSRW